MTRAASRWARFGVTLGAELRMQLRQQLAMTLTVLLPIVGAPLALAGAHVYAGTVSEIQSAGAPVTTFDPLPDKLPVAVPAGTEAWILAGDGLVAVPADQALAELRLEGADGVPNALPLQATIVYTPDADANRARARLERVLDRRKRRLRDAAFDAAGLVPLKSSGLEWRADDRSPPGSEGRTLVVPVVTLVMAMAAMYTALDVTTGERERGTLETLLVAAADRRVVAAAKLAAVAVLAVGAGWLALAAMVGGRAAGIPGIPQLGAGEVALVAAGIASVGALITAGATAIASAAPSYRSASLTMSGALLAALIPSAMGALGVELTVPMALVPIGGVALAVRDGLFGVLSPFDAALVGLATAGWTALFAVAYALRAVRDDAVGAPDAAASRRLGHHGRDAVGLFAVAWLLVILLGGAAQGIALVPGLVFTEVVLLAGVGLAGVVWTGQPLGRTLGLSRPSARTVALAIAVGVCAPGLGGSVLALQQRALPTPEVFAAGFQVLTDLPLAVRIGVGAILPAVCEEILCRGALLGLTRGWPTWARIASNALMFGMLHASVHRLLPTAALGALLAWVRLASGSLLAPMIVHALNNLLALTVLTAATEAMSPSALTLGLGAAMIAAMAGARAMGSREDAA